MALNHLFHRHQESLMRSASAATPEARGAHADMAGDYAARIRAIRAGLGGILVGQTRVS